MAASGGSSGEHVNAFEVDGTYLFKHYFEGEEVFDRLGEFYNGSQYRFEVPADEFAPLQSFLGERGYELVAVDAVDAFVVAVEKYTAHPENIFRESVSQRGAEGYNCFLMTDQYAVAGAVAEGATRITDLDVPSPYA